MHQTETVESLVPVNPVPGKIYNYYEHEKELRRQWVSKQIFILPGYDVIRNPLDPRLYAPNKKIKNPQDFKIVELAKTLVGLHIIEGGVGLAAPQIGVNLQMFVVSLGGNKNAVFMNPRIVGASESGGVDWAREGCLSHPGISLEICRMKEFDFIASTITHPKPTMYHADGMFARIFQHELCHLQGKLITDTPEDLKRGFQIERKGQEHLFKENAHAEEHGFKEPQV
jgi:peptide deformylase